MVVQGESSVSFILNDARARSEQEKASGLPAKVTQALLWSGKATRKSSCVVQCTNGPCASADYKRQKDSARGTFNLDSVGEFC